jgi:hypothetical protein
MPMTDVRQTAGILLDIASHARRWRGEGQPIPLPEIAYIARTVAQAPEVVVKVSGGAKSAKAAVAHLRYIDRHGRLDIETDKGEVLKGRGVENELVVDWDLSGAEAEMRAPYRGMSGRRPTKVVHNIVLSMPKGTPAEKVLAASRAFAREQFALTHRYALVLHTDQDHPHVHLAVKAVSEEGKRLNIRKATLRDWRRQFAQHLRAQGLAANATDRSVRGQTRTPMRDGIYRASRRGESTHVRRRLERVITRLRDGGVGTDRGKAKVVETRTAVVHGWQAAAEALIADGRVQLAEQIWKFIAQMRPPESDDERLASEIRKRVRPTPAREPLERSR